MKQEFALRPRTLFLPYLIVPGIFFYWLVGTIAFPALLTNLPTSPQNIFILGIFVEKPHIIASALTMLDTEYLQTFRKKLFIGALIIAPPSLLLYRWNITAFLLIFFGWTVYHVIKQQIGIGRMLNQSHNRLYELWGWLFVLTSLLIALAIGYLSIAPTTWLAQTLPYLVFGSGLVAVIIGFIAALSIPTIIGKRYLYANNLVIVASCILYWIGIPLFSILLPRIVHDVTAFMIYIDHDTNRNRPQPKQWIYKLMAPLRLPIWLVCIALSVALAMLLLRFQQYSLVFAFAVGISIYHYYTEAFMWKRDSPYRSSLRFKQ